MKRTLAAAALALTAFACGESHRRRRKARIRCSSRSSLMKARFCGSRGLATAMGASLSVQSTEGRGSTFTLTLRRDR